MECRDVRERLAERALGTLERDAARWIDRHVGWCAACRREAEELAEGAAAIPLAVGGPAPPPALEGRVVRAVSRAAGRSSRGRRVAVVAAAIAGVVAATSIAWALSVQDRIGVLERAAGRAEREAALSTAEWARLFGFFADPALSATLVPVGRGTGGGRAVVYDSQKGADSAVVIVGGLPAGGRYHAAIVTPSGNVALGRLSPTSPGSLAVSRIFRDDLAGAEAVVVRDARGRDVLRGRLGRFRA